MTQKGILPQTTKKALGGPGGDYNSILLWLSTVNTRWFYLSYRDPLGTTGLMTVIYRVYKKEMEIAIYPAIIMTSLTTLSSNLTSFN